MRAEKEEPFFNNTVIFSIVVTGDKFRHPGGPEQFSPSIENQSLHVAGALIAKIGSCKSCVIEYSRDGTANITKFTITIQCLSKAKFADNQKAPAHFSSVFTSSSVEINSKERLPLPAIPYRCEKVEIKSALHEGPLPKLSKSVTPAYSKNYHGVLEKVNISFVMSVEEAARQEKLEAEDKVDFIGSNSSEFSHLTTLKFSVFFDIPPFKQGPRDQDIYELAKIATNHFSGIPLNYAIEFTRTGPNSSWIIKALFTFTLLLRNFNRAGLRNSIESYYPSTIPGGIAYKIIFGGQDFSLTQTPFNAKKVFYVSPKVLSKKNDFDGCDKVTRTVVNFESPTEKLPASNQDLVRPQFDGFSRPIKEDFTYQDPMLSILQGVERTADPEKVEKEKAPTVNEAKPLPAAAESKSQESAPQVDPLPELEQRLNAVTLSFFSERKAWKTYRRDRLEPEQRNHNVKVLLIPESDSDKADSFAACLSQNHFFLLKTAKSNNGDPYVVVDLTMTSTNK